MMNLLEKWRDKATRYVDVRLQLIKLGIIQRTANVISSMMLGIILLFFFFTMFIFMGMGIMKVLSVWFDSEIWGAFATAGFFLIFILVIGAMRKTITTAFAGIFIGIITESDEDDDNDENDEKTKFKDEDEDEEESD